MCGTAGSTSAVRLTPAFVTRLFEESITYKLPENTTGESEMVRITVPRQLAVWQEGTETHR